MSAKLVKGMIIGASLGSFKGQTLTQAMALYSKLSKDFNLDAVELRFERERRKPSMWSWEITANNEIVDFLEKFKIVGAHLPFAYLNPISPNPRIKNESMTELKNGIEKAAELGMDYVTMHARGEAYDFTHEEKMGEWVKVFVELADYAEEHDIILTVENADFLSNLTDLTEIVEEIDSKWLRITLDVGHAHIRVKSSLASYALKALDRTPMPFITKKYMPYEEYDSITNFLEKEHDKIFNSHIHDYDGKSDHLTIGNGKINFSFLPTLKRMKFSGPLILESIFNTHEDFKKNYKRLEEAMRI